MTRPMTIFVQSGLLFISFALVREFRRYLFKAVRLLLVALSIVSFFFPPLYRTKLVSTK